MDQPTLDCSGDAFKGFRQSFRQALLVGIDAYGIQQRPDFQSPQAVKKYVRKAITALRGLSLS
jgi:hypothetical protein